ncbi:UbiH/UbiF family hydroxylase [Sulfuriferula nivalis]|uniref:Ubiquinone biosynthesis hydroxylase UbiH n=1 Tax=Sulfuriferula nivalis TaxID=2675298 RepID=A0A809SAH5_9PROT|nr:UbiH/UbiF family hydroxylase [Sulfuriferula nivalis]BBP02003.1 ubiquinone biosynthesis hydroxylase UbiH [Sulfuriferula nivalis]
MSNHEFDIIIIGAGIVGAAFAVAMRDSSLRIAMIEPHPPTAPTEEWDTRIYAISPGSQDFLSGMGIWQQLEASRIQPVYAMDIRGDSAAQLQFDAYQAGVPQLAAIMESGRLQHALWQAMQAQENITLFNTPCADLHWSAQGAQLKLADSTVLTADLIVGADGGKSWVREQAGINFKRSDYEQSGVVANFIVEHDHQGTAHQWFNQTGVLAWLPLPNGHMSMVWSTDAQHTAALMTASPEQLAEEVAQAGGRVLGKLQQVGRTAAFPLSINRVERLVQQGLALIGDAAHGVHPLAGQGVNLGLRDARELAQTLKQRGKAGCGELLLLQRYQRARRTDIVAMQTMTDSLHHLFRNTNPVLAKLRNAGMSFTNQITPLKSWLMRQALN